MQQELKNALAFKHLTPREIEVVDHLLKGLSNREIGNLLHIKEKTVKFHVCNIYKRTGMTNRAQFIIAYMPYILGGAA